MATPEDSRSGSDAVDEWIAEVGEERIAAVIAATKRGVADGTIPTFGDRESLFRHVERISANKPW